MIKALKLGDTFLFILIGLGIYLVHSFILNEYFESISFFYPLWGIYAFMILTVMLILVALKTSLSKGNNKVFNLFMGLTLLKMLLAVAFFVPLIVSGRENNIPDVLNFFIPYFIFLGLEIFFATKVMNRQ